MAFTIYRNFPDPDAARAQATLQSSSEYAVEVEEAYPEGCSYLDAIQVKGPREAPETPRGAMGIIGAAMDGLAAIQAPC